ncbi:MAG: extracellular solute-binding protein [Deltaproteobacteria bacterium]|nr:extracellular solute-binding protein [Deltaproteobacteria bacterium]
MKCKNRDLLLVGFFTFVLFPLGLEAQITDDVINGAKKEGKLVYYTALNVIESREVLLAFQKKHPFIKIDLFRLSAEKLRTKILTEARAGRHAFDTVSNNVVDIGLLLRAGVLGQYRAREAGAILEGLKDEKSFWTAIYFRQYVLTYNTRMLGAKEVPSDWWHLLEPKWKNKIGMDEEETEWYAGLSMYWGKEKARKFMTGLASQEPAKHRGHTVLAQLTSAGEFPLSIGYAHQIMEMKNKTAPLDFVSTTDPVVTSPTVIALSKDAVNPNAARLFIEFVLSREGQTILRNFGRVTARTDIPPPNPRLNPRQLKSFFVNPQIAEHYQEYQKDYNEIFSR